MDTIDARGLACPEPVVRVKKALEAMDKGKLTVLVNSTTSRQNVQRFAEKQGCTVKIDEKDGEYTMEIVKTGQPVTAQVSTGAGVLLVTSDKLGTGDDDLGELLMAGFINTLTETCAKPDRILFLNSGVMLALEGSRVLDTLKELEEAGVEIFSCGTCLNHYQVKDKLAVGKVTNMYDTVDTLLGAEKVVRI